jgi:hypothetical protein
MGVWDVAILWPASPTSIHVRAEAELTRATDAATANREPIIRFMLGCVCRVLVFLKNVRRRNFGRIVNPFFKLYKALSARRIDMLEKWNNYNSF